MPNAAFTDTNLFAPRHHGRPATDTQAMLETIGVQTIDELIDKTIPATIRLKSPMTLAGIDSGCTEAVALAEAKALAEQNTVKRSMIGQGYHGTHTPPVILRNMLESPLWYTPYTPYQPEISQGRLEALLNFQTMISDLTGLPLANASLLDEATAAAEAMAMCFAVGRQKKKRFIASSSCHPQTLAVIATRAETMGIELIIADPRNLRTPRKGSQQVNIDSDVCGVLVQYPDTEGYVHDYSDLCEQVHAAGGLVVAACDILSLCLLTPPGEWNTPKNDGESASGGADIAVGSTQRFGVPMGFGGPHAAYMATHEKHVRKMPGRLIGVTRDAHGDRALRLSIQTREQHIKRDRATSNICTAQALLANIAGMYAVWHGPEGLKQIASRVHAMAGLLKQELDKNGLATNSTYFDTITATVRLADPIIARAVELGINLRKIDDETISVACDETTTLHDLYLVLQSFGAPIEEDELLHAAAPQSPIADQRSPFLEHPVFNQYHTEHELLRYITRLQNRDISLANSMISLGSCTMKLNAAAEMIPVTFPGFADLHPYAPVDQTLGYQKLFKDLENWLAAITGLPGVSLQPNAGSQGEYAGLLAIKRFHEANDGDSGSDKTKRDICLIPTSAHGTNPASAVIAGMKVVPVGCMDNGDIDLIDLKVKAEKHAENLSALMITYPSTHGVFEDGVQEACQIIHDHGGKVYMDGANMNAQVGLTNPGVCGADVCHLNLHKTFCIPHGGGGPGMGPICCTEALAPYLPTNPIENQKSKIENPTAVSAAHYGSPMILPISWMYIRMMGPDGLTDATKNAILNANYMAAALKDQYNVLYTGPNGTCAHEYILDARPFAKSAHVTVEDIAKRLIDFGFHAPTMSWPVAGTLMIEPTESESKAELDRFIQAMQTIRTEIAAIESGQLDPEDNPLKHAPHTAIHVSSDTWPHTYPRKQGAYPAAWLEEHGAKFWPPVGRVDNAYGDKNLVCTCPSVEEMACEIG